MIILMCENENDSNVLLIILLILLMAILMCV